MITNDRVTKVIYLGSNGNTRQTLFDYNTSGQIGVNVTGTNTPTLSTGIYSLNDKQQITKQLFANGRGDYELYTYDASGNLASTTGYLNVTTTTSASYKDDMVYDQRKSFFSNLKGNLFLLFNNTFINNITSITANEYAHPSHEIDYSKKYF